MSEILSLEVSNRKIQGKKVKKLRRSGQIPAIVYGPGYEPLKVSIEQQSLRHILAQAGGTQLIELKIGKEKVPTLARKVQRDPIRGDILHVDFYRVAMDRSIRADVPILIVNESPAVTAGAGNVTHLLNSLEIEALPADLPPHIEVDISSLNQVGDQILVGDLKLADKLTVHTQAEEVIVKIDYLEALPEEEEEEPDLVEVISAEEVEVITERREKEDEEE